MNVYAEGSWRSYNRRDVKRYMSKTDTNESCRTYVWVMSRHMSESCQCVTVCWCVCVRVCVCVCVCARACIYSSPIFWDVHLYTDMHTCTFVCMHIRMYVMHTCMMYAIFTLQANCRHPSQKSKCLFWKQLSLPAGPLFAVLGLAAGGAATHCCLPGRSPPPICNNEYICSRKN